MSKKYSNLNVTFEKNHRSLFAFILAALILAAGFDAQSQTLTNFMWNNSGTNFTGTTSWTNGVAPTGDTSASSNNVIEFSNFGASNNTVSLSSGRSVGTILFSSTANNYTFDALASTQRIGLYRGITNNNSTGTQTFNLRLDNSANNTWYQVAGGSMIFNTNVGLTAPSSSTSRTLTLTGGGTYDFKGSFTQGNSTNSKLVVNNSGGTVNLRAANSMGGGIVITSGQVNFYNAQSLGTGIVELGAVTGSAYGGSILNNASGNAIALTGITGVTWSGSTTSGNTGIQFGTSASTSANDIDFGSGLVTASTSRSMNIAGTNVTISMGTLNVTGNSAKYDFTLDGVGNTIDFDGWRLGVANDQDKAVSHQLKGSANVNMGAIVNGTPGTNGITYANGAIFNSEGVTRLTGNNTYTGATEFVGSGTNIISGNNSAAVGNVTIAGGSGTGKTPTVRLDNVNGISSSSSLLGASSSAQIGTLDLRAAGNFSLNSFGTVSKDGNNMIFMNSSGSQKTLAFTAANNYISSASAGGKTLYNNSANLLLDFDGNIEIGGDSAGGEATTFAGVGNFNVDGNLLDTGTGLTRILRKQGGGTLTLRGSANSIRGSTLVETGTLDLYGNLTASTDIVVSTTGTSTNGARTVNSTLNVRDTGSLLNSSTTTVWARGNLIVDGTAGTVVVKNYGSLGGSGTVGAVTLESGSLLNPGNSPGTLTADSSIWKSGSTYNWEINQASGGTAGVNWDLFDVTNALDLSALSSNAKMNLVLNSLSSMDDFNTTDPYSWVIAQAGSLVGAGGVVSTAFTAGANVTDLFNINTTAFNGGAQLPSYFKVEVGETTTAGGSTLQTLKLMTIPEPSTGSMFGLGLAGLVVTRLLRRKNS